MYRDAKGKEMICNVDPIVVGVVSTLVTQLPTHIVANLCNGAMNMV